jgi:transposase
MSDLFWYSDEQWGKVEPHLPTNQQGPARHDDRRILSGIMHVQRSGCRWKDCPSEYGPSKTIYNRFARWSERGIWAKIFEPVAAHERTPDQVSLDASLSCQSSPLCWRRKRGAQIEAISLTKGGRNSKIHAVVDEFCRPWVFVLTPGNAADCTLAETCVRLIPGIKELLADKGYGSDSFRAFLSVGIKPVIPGRSNRKMKIRYDKKAYKKRNVVERCFCRLKDFRRVATRYDKLARNFFSALCLVATFAYWL